MALGAFGRQMNDIQTPQFCNRSSHLKRKGGKNSGCSVLMSNVLGVLRGARLYTAGYAKQSFLQSAVSAF